MKTTTLFKVLAALCCTFQLFSQEVQYQYFDGDDTIPGESLFVYVDTASIWQIGPPQKPVFNNAATVPNVLVTDTLNMYRDGDTSIFYVHIPLVLDWGIMALEWMQQLDYPQGAEGGIVEFWNEEDQEWSNCFDHPYVYNYYGYEAGNVALTPFGKAFTGQDSTWNSIWLCFDASYFSLPDDTIHVRFVHYSDTIANPHEGWMIDNMLSHETYVHTVAEKQQEKYMEVFPTVSTGIFNIRTKKKQEFHIIEHMEVYDHLGNLVKQLGVAPTISSINLDELPPGNYVLKVTTNFQAETFQIVIN